jgi:cellulose synthase/poly-beta-1,6-N-acetylglucosamine synthase-like glycosyltransferase
MLVDIFVVADNCTDATAVIARAAGAQAIERTDPEHRGKGYALDFAFRQLEQLGPGRAPGCFLVVDADSEVTPNFIAATAGALREGAAAVQSRYLVSNKDESTRTRLMDLALRAFNVVRPLGRERLGLSAGLFGNGFGLRRETLQAVPYGASSVVEDLEYHLALVRSGRRVVFIDDPIVFSEMPVRGRGVVTQRTRWEGGRLRMLLDNAPALLADVLRGRLRCLEPLLDLLLLPLAFNVTLLVVAATTPLPLVRDLGLAGLAVVTLHLGAAIASGASVTRDLAILASAPFYVLWKLMLIPSLLRSARPSNDWVRTARNAESPGIALAAAADPDPPNPPAE